MKRRFDYILIKLESLVDANARQLEELSTLNITRLPNESMELKILLAHIQEMSMSFNLQYLMLPNKISYENQQFTLLSNIMKNKHDTAKNAINNIR